MTIQLTDRVVRELPSPTTGNRITYDAEVTGFGVRVTAAGAKSFVLNYRAHGRERRITIGSLPDWPVRQAREQAKSLKRRIDMGDDPMAERHAERAAPTVDQLADRFEVEHLPRKRSSTQREYQSLVKLIRLHLGQIKVVELRYADIEAMHRKIMQSAPYRANRTVAVLSKMLTLSIKWGFRQDNPCRGIEKAPERKRQTFLTPAQVARLGEVLAAHPERISANAVRLLLLTGARKGETLRARWDDIDLAAGVWLKPGHTTKQTTDHRVPLSPPALALLSEMKAEADVENARRVKDGSAPISWVFPGSKPTNGEWSHLQDIKHFWASVCETAGLKGIRLHDLRHTYASILASSGLSLPIIGALLGHSNPQTTARYAHLLDDPLRAATERAAAIITGAGKPVGEILSIAGGKRA
jgi:integrase